MKKFLFVFLAALMLFAVGCGDSNEEKDEPFKAATYEVGGESADKVRTLILDSLKLKGLSDETYEVYKAAFESRYEIPTEEDTTTAEMKVTL